MAVPMGRALIQPKEIINKYVHIRQELGVGAEEEWVTEQRGQGSIHRGGCSTKQCSCPVIQLVQM